MIAGDRLAVKSSVEERTNMAGGASGAQGTFEFYKGEGHGKRSRGLGPTSSIISFVIPLAMVLIVLKCLRRIGDGRGHLGDNMASRRFMGSHQGGGDDPCGTDDSEDDSQAGGAAEVSVGDLEHNRGQTSPGEEQTQEGNPSLPTMASQPPTPQPTSKFGPNQSSHSRSRPHTRKRRRPRKVVAPRHQRPMLTLGDFVIFPPGLGPGSRPSGPVAPMLPQSSFDPPYGTEAGMQPQYMRTQSWIYRPTNLPPRSGNTLVRAIVQGVADLGYPYITPWDIPPAVLPHFSPVTFHSDMFLDPNAMPTPQGPSLAPDSRLGSEEINWHDQAQGNILPDLHSNEEWVDELTSTGESDIGDEHDPSKQE